MDTRTNYHTRLSPIISRGEDDDLTALSSRESSRFSESSSASSSSSTQDVVTDTLRDVITLQQNAMKRIRDDADRQKLNYVLKATYDEMVGKYNEEKLEHEKTKVLLQKEQNRCQFALGEIDILTKHLEKEKREHDELIKSVNLKASRETKRSDLLHIQCTEHEEAIQRHRDELRLKDNEILNLKQRLKSQKDAHKNLLDDIELERVQHEYMTRSLNRDRCKRGAV